ncbi:hypothetical protein [Agrobacterium vitis]|uniref:Uncharacterized protein n=1 Tax=Agrobacterium vitis TaxID=373 RepID=A0A7K1RBG6_AGRVI|nr:hypothetical protein [Agrobacterium vitis]MVA55479.1 hypothetical protein [Agrobacterium vitis]
MNIPQKITGKPGPAWLETLLCRGFTKKLLTIKIKGAEPSTAKLSNSGNFRGCKASN